MAMTVTGFAEFTRLLRTLGIKAPIAAGGALYREAERIMTAAKSRTPVDTSALKNSGQVALPDVTTAGVVVEMGFGNTSVGYAVPVHERLDVFHPNGQAKFLESAVNDAQRGMDQRLAADVGREIERSAR